MPDGILHKAHLALHSLVPSRQTHFDKVNACERFSALSRCKRSERRSAVDTRVFHILKQEEARLRDNRGKPLHETLSDREYQVMWMIASGKTVRQIADELFLSPNTVSTHRTRILRKMNMKSNAELMHYAIAHHLVD